MKQEVRSIIDFFTRLKPGQKAFIFFTLLAILILPIFPPLFTPVISIAGLIWIFSGMSIRNWQYWSSQKWRPQVFLLSIPYLLFLAGMLYTDNIASGGKALEVKMSIALFPLVFSNLDERLLRKQFLNAFLGLFVSGGLISSVLLLVRALLRYGSGEDAGVFYYGELAFKQHSSYLSMYLLMAAFILICFQIRKKLPLVNIYQLPLILFLLMIVLLSSKAALLSLVILLLFILIYHLIIDRFRFAWRPVVFSIVISVVFYLAFPKAGERMKVAGASLQQEEVVNGQSKDGTAARIVFWKTSFEVISERPLSGYGTGDGKDALIDGFVRNDYVLAKEMNANCHNQFLQDWLSTGIIGLFALIFVLLFPFILAWRKKYVLLMGFLLIIGINLMVESMFERQAGMVFYGFFSSVLLTFMLASGSYFLHDTEG